MKILYDEVLRRFPEMELWVDEGDEDSIYVVVGYIKWWLVSVANPTLPDEVVSRVVDFYRWCMEQPRGETASDDIATIVVVGLLEERFENDALLPIIPQLMSREELLQARDYLTTWVGADRYQAALQLTDRGM